MDPNASPSTTSASTASSTTSSPQPLHNPSQAAVVQAPQAPLGNQTNGSGPVNAAMGQRALLAKKMATGNNPSIVSPTDNLMTPVTAKLSQKKKNHFSKGGALKPLSFGASKIAESAAEDDDE